jgi:glycosidase
MIPKSKQFYSIKTPPTIINPHLRGKTKFCTSVLSTNKPVFADSWGSYFLLPDRFSNDKETGYVNNSGDPVATAAGAPLFRASDKENAVQNEVDTKEWLDAGAKFVGGTLTGVASKLGYLKRLGITALWIGPIFKQVAALETYHGYGVQNFLDVDPRFGTKEDLKHLVKKAHDMGIYIILDIILNHCGDVFAYSEDNPYPVFDNGKTYPVRGFYDADRNPTLPFETVNLEQHPEQFPDGAIWPAEFQNGGQIFTHEGQIRNWDSSPEYLDGDFFDLKDISLGPDSVDFFTPTPGLKAFVETYKYWIAYADLDAYRLDTVKHMGSGPTRYFCSAIHEFASAIGKDNFIIIGEITGTGAFQAVEVTGLDAALGIGEMQQALWNLPKGLWNPQVSWLDWSASLKHHTHC